MKKKEKNLSDRKEGRMHKDEIGEWTEENKELKKEVVLGDLIGDKGEEKKKIENDGKRKKRKAVRSSLYMNLKEKKRV